MKRFLIILALLIMPFVAVNAQDNRNRATSTIVSDALAQMPAQTPDVYNQVMAELAATGAEGVEMMAMMLEPMAEGVNNSPVEYAVNGVASFVTKEGAAHREGVRAGLKAAIADYDNRVAFASKVEAALAAAPANFPEIEIADMYGKKQSLTAVQEGKVLLLDFWSIADENALFRNAELKEIYNQYHNKGFEIYQVSVDTSKPAWVEVVQMQKLPWISVCDFKGASSLAVQLFGISGVPQNFLIDREGNIVARNAYGDNLTKELKKLIK